MSYKPRELISHKSFGLSENIRFGEVINQTIQGSVKKLADTPEYTTLQEVKTDFRLDQIVTLLHEINGRLIELEESK